QMAISIVLLVGAALFVRTLMNLRHLDLGFDREHVLALRLEPRGSNQKRQNGVRLMQLYDGLLGRLRAVPGVRSVSLAGATPLGNENPLMIPVTVAGYVQKPGEDMHVRLLQVYPGYFDTMAIPILAGRDLSDTDNNPDALNDPAARRVVVVNDRTARRFFGTAAAAIGRRLDVPMNRSSFEIVGVAGDARERALKEEILPVAYASYAHATTGRGQ